MHRFVKQAPNVSFLELSSIFAQQRRLVPLYFRSVSGAVLAVAEEEIRLTDLRPHFEVLADYDELFSSVPEEARYNVALLYGAMGLRRAALDAARLIPTREHFASYEIKYLRWALAPKFGIDASALTEESVRKAWADWAKNERTREPRAFFAGIFVGSGAAVLVWVGFLILRRLRRRKVAPEQTE